MSFKNMTDSQIDAFFAKDESNPQSCSDTVYCSEYPDCEWGADCQGEHAYSGHNPKNGVRVMIEPVFEKTVVLYNPTDSEATVEGPIPVDDVQNTETSTPLQEIEKGHTCEGQTRSDELNDVDDNDDVESVSSC